MKEKVAVATVQGRAYFLIVNALREQGIDFVSLVPGEPMPGKVKVVITTEQEKSKVNYGKILVFKDEDELESLIIEVKKLLLGKETYEKLVVGIDPGEAIGLAVLADGKVIEEGNYYSSHELTSSILKVLKTVNFATTDAVVKIGNGVPVYKELLEDLDCTLPLQVALEVVSEAGTNRPLKAHSRKIRHISSAIRIAGRNGPKYTRRKTIASNSTTQ
ncbi:MAG: hypothetical protein M1540_01630 [Candidatus Bathyarchaeota archaeon]|nr:hypothetical protein [Candidatus Bathyarchaeota archaeon]